jgi:hypothetical protein
VFSIGFKEDLVRLVYNPAFEARIPAAVKVSVDSVGKMLRDGTFRALDDVLQGADTAKKITP